MVDIAIIRVIPDDLQLPFHDGRSDLLNPLETLTCLVPIYHVASRRLALGKPLKIVDYGGITARALVTW